MSRAWIGAAVLVLVLALGLSATRERLTEARGQAAAAEAAHRLDMEQVRRATAEARAADVEAARAAEAEQARINRRLEHDYQERIAAVRARAGRLRLDAEADRAGDGDRGGADLSAAGGAAGGADAATGEGGFPALSAADALIATEQAIQLDALIDWIEARGAPADARE